jgi:hypothetical protein
LGQVIGTVFTATTGPVAGITAAAATWMLIAAIGGLIGGLIGGHVGSYPAITAEQVRRAA